MFYLSQLLDKKILYHNTSVGKVVDLAVNESASHPYVTKILFKQSGRKVTIPGDAVSFENDHWILQNEHIPQANYDEKDFYLSEDLLDKQVIDVNGKRLVRVNDVLLKKNGVLQVEGIDIGFSGILRRLGIGGLPLNTITLPWSLIEAFDYQTGTVRIKVTQNRLNTFQPAEIADILEEAGTKERIGIIESLDAPRAALAIEESDEGVQTAILEQVSSSRLKKIIEKMHLSELADIVQDLNPFTHKEILHLLGHDKAEHVQKLSRFADDVAGGLMDTWFYQESGEKTAGEAMAVLQELTVKPESVIVLNGGEKVSGMVPVKNLITNNPSTPLKEMITKRNYVFADTPFLTLVKIFSKYNLRILPVVDKNKKVMGVITVDNILAGIQEKEYAD